MRRLVRPSALFLVLAIAMSLPALLVMTPTVAEAAKAAKVKKSATDPETVIRNIYKQYDKHAGPAEAEQQNFSESLYKLWIDVQAATTGVDDVGVDFDVFLDARDLDEVRDLTTEFTPDGDSKGSVGVKFTVTGKARTMTYSMVRAGRGWKIDNISWGPKRKDLRTLLSSLKKNGAQMSN